MSEKTRIKLIGIVLVAVSIWAFYSNSDDTQQLPPEQSTGATIPAITGVIEDKAHSQIDFTSLESKSWGRDPFYYDKFMVVEPIKPTGEFKPQSLGWHLSGILYNPASPVAIINNQAMKVGDSLANATVIYIDKAHVILKVDDKELKLKVARG